MPLAPGFTGNPNKPVSNLAPGFGQQQSFIPEQEIVPDATSYDTGYLQDHGSRNAYRERMQTSYEMWRNSLTQAGGEILMGAGEGVGYLLDFPQWGNIIQGTEKEYSNWFSDLMKKGQEGLAEETPIFQTDEAKEAGWAPTDATWWATHIPSIASAISLLIPTRGAIALVGKGARAFGAAKLVKQGSKIAELLEGVGSAMISRYMENTMEASEIFQATYQKALAQGETDEVAKQMAGEAASTTWYSNLVNLGTDIFQYTTLLKAGKVAKGLGRQAFDFGKQMAAEGIEEAAQSVISKESQAAALGRFDPYGKDFSTRLSEYLSDPDLHTAAFFGAIGGGVFGVVGAKAEYQRNAAQRKIDEALAIERAAQVGDIDKINAIKNSAFAELAFKHITQGSVETLRDDLEELKKTPNLDQDTRQGLERHIKNLDFLEANFNNMIDQQTTPEELITPLLATQLDIKNTSEDISRLKQTQQKLNGEITQRTEVDAAYVNLKNTYHLREAWKNLAAKSGKDFNKEISFYDKLYWDQVAMLQDTVGGQTGPIELKIQSSNDPQIQDSYNKLLAQEQRLEMLKQDLADLNSPDGANAYLATKKQRQINTKAEAVLANPKATIAELEVVLKTNPSPEIANVITAKIEAKRRENADEKKDVTKAALNKEEIKPKKESKQPQAKEPKLPEPKVPEPKEPEIDPKDVELVFGRGESMYDVVPGVSSMPDPDPSKVSGSVADIADFKQLSSVSNRLDAELPAKDEPMPETNKAKTEEQTKPVDSVKAVVAKTVLKEIAGSWKKEKVMVDGNEYVVENFVVDTNADTTPKREKYYLADDARKTKPYDAIDIFESVNRILAVNTPNVNVGDTVAIVVEPDWKFWKSNRPSDVVMNVYKVVDGKRVGKPLTQIPASHNAKGEPTKTSTPESNMLREAVWKAHQAGKKEVRTTVVYKNYGDLLALRNSDGSRLENNLSVLETDMIKTDDWRVGKTSHNPILGYIDAQGILQIPNIDLMEGIDSETATLARNTLIRKAAPGTIVTLRRNSTGGFVAAQIDPRQLTVEELDWVKKNLADKLKNKEYEDLKTMIYIDHVDVKTPVTEYSKRHILNKAGDVMFHLPSGYWVQIAAEGKFGKNFAAFMNNQQFFFQVYNAQGEKSPDLYNSTKAKPEMVEEMKKTFNDLLENSFKNIDKNFLNLENRFVDVLGNSYKNYYEYLKATNSATTDLPAGYSIFNSTIYLDANIQEKSAVEPITKEVIKTPKPKAIEKIASPKESTEPKKTGKRGDISERGRKGREKRFRLTTPTGTFRTIGEKELSWMRDKFSDYLSIAEGVDRVISDGGLEAYGYFHNAMIRLAQFAEEGSGYHEAFHFVTLTQLTDAQYAKLLKEGEKVYKTKTIRDTEEALAEDFRQYMLSGGTTAAKVASAKPLFKRILDYILQALGFKVSIENTFKDIANYQPDARSEKNIRAYQERFKEVDDLRHRLVPGFMFLNEQLESLDAATQLLLEKALRDSKDVAYDELLGIPENLDKYLEELRGDFKKTLAEVEAQYADESIELSDEQLDDLATKADLLKAILDNWENTNDGLNTTLGFKSKTIKNLAKYGFSIKTVSSTGKVTEVTEMTQEGDINTTVEEQDIEAELEDPTDKERIHGVSFLVQSPLKTLSGKVKKFLATIPEYVVTGERALTIFGTPKFIDFNRVYANLTSKLAGHKNIYSRLSELATSDPILRSVKEQLDIHMKAGQTMINPLPAQFFTTFNRSKYKFFTTLTGFEDGMPIARVIETDRRGIERVLADEWRTNAVSRGLISSDGQPNKGKVSKLRKALESLDEREKKRQVTYEELKNSAIELLHESGIDLSPKIWEKIDKSGKQSTLVRSILFGQSAGSLEQMLKIADEGRDPFEETGLVNRLAEESIPYTEDLQAKTFINEKGNQVSAINLNTYVTDLISQLSDEKTGGEKARWFMNDKFYKNNEFLKLAINSDTRASLKVNVFSAFRDGTTAEAKEYGDTTVQDSFISRLTAFHNSGTNTGYFYVGTLSDKSQQVAITLPKKKDTNARVFLEHVLANTVNNEITRIQRLNAKLQGRDKDLEFSPNDVANYGKANSFKYIPDLNKIDGLALSLSKGEIDANDLGAFAPLVDKAITEFINNERNAYFDKLIELGLISKSGEIYKNENLPEALEEVGINKLLSEFFYNDFAWRIEMSKVLHGDIAFYGTAEKYFKRGYQLITPGLQGYYNPELKSAGKKEVYKRAIVTSSKKNNDEAYILSLAQLIDPNVKSLNSKSRAVKIAKAYAKDINKTDAQAYCTIETFRDISIATGQWTEDHDWFYENAWKDGKSVRQAIAFNGLSPEQKEALTYLEGKLLLQPLKPFTYGDRLITLSDGSKMLLKEQYKESITPLLPEWANRHDRFAPLLAAMIRDKVDIVSDAESVKVGAYAINSDLNQPLVTREIPADSMRFPFIVPAKAKKEILAGTQIEKLILGNVLPDTNYKVGNETVKGKELISRYHNTWASIIKEDAEAFREKFGLDESLTVPTKNKELFYQKLQAVLLEELDNRDLPENYIDSLQIIYNKLQQPEFLVGLDFPALGRKYEQVITNLFKKYIITQKLPGDALINLADYGVGGSSELKFITNNNGEIVEAEVGVPERFVKGLGLRRDVHYDANGKLKWNELKPEVQEALKLIIYRIPTQGKNSMLPVRIVMVLPESAGSVIMLPGEMTKQGGMDFDVDKSYIMKRTLEKGKVNNSLSNQLFDMHWAVLTNTAHAEELLNPLDAAVHDEVITYLEERGVVTRNVKNSPFSVVTDLEQEKLAKYSKAMIGVFSKFSVGHATLQSIPAEQISITTPIEIVNDEYSYDTLGKLRDDEGNLISDNHSAQQNSALDAQKDPKLGYLNITTFNANVLAYMTNLGVNQKLALIFMNQPILRELADTYFKNGDSNVVNAVNTLTAKPAYAGLKTLMDDTKKNRIETITAGNLDESLTQPITANLKHQAQVLADFMNYFYAAQDMAKVNTALSTDTARDFTSIAAIEAFVDTVEYVQSPASKVRLDKAVFDIKESTVKRVAAFYHYGVSAALKFTKQFYPYSSQAFRAVRKAIAVGTLQRNDKLRDKEDIIAVNQAMISYTLGENNQLKNYLNKYSPDYNSRWDYFTPSKSMMVYLSEVKKKYPEINKNVFIQALGEDIVGKKRKGTVQLVGINNTHGNFNKTNLTNAWNDLLKHREPAVQQLAKDLVRYSIETTGFKTTPTGFIDVVPAEFWRESGLAPYVSRIHQAYSDGAKTINAEDVAKIVIRHLFSSTTLVKSTPIKINKDFTIESKATDVILEKGTTHVLEFKANKDMNVFDDKSGEDRWARFTRVFDKKARKWRLYECQEGTTVYREIQPLGEGNKFTEFVSSPDAKSIIPEYKNLRPAYLESTEIQVEEFDPSMEQAYEAVGLGSRVNDAGDVLLALREVETDVKRKELIERMIPNISKLQGLKVVVDTELDAPGVYDPMDNTVFVSPRIATPEGLRHVLTHEFQHAYGVKAYRTPSSNLEINFKQSVDRALAEAKTYIKTEEYGLESGEEFIAELASNPEFRAKVKAKPGLFQKIVRMFRRLLGLNDSFDNLIEQFYEVMDQAETLTYFGNDRFYIKSKAQIELEGVMKKIIKNYEKRIGRLLRTGQDASDDKKFVKSVTELSDKKALVTYVAHTIKEIEKLDADFKKMLEQPDKVVASKIRRFKEQLNLHKVLVQVRDHVASNPQEYKDLANTKKNLVQAMDEVLGMIRTMENKLNEASIDVVGNWVVNKSSETLDINDVKRQLRVADRDISILNRALDAIIDARDSVLQVIGKVVTEARAKAFRKTERLLKGKWLDVNEKYEQWLRTQKIDPTNLRERNKFILDPKSFNKDSSAIYFIDMDSKQGKEILARPKGDPLRDYYELVVGEYIKSQKKIPRHMKPGYRIPSIRRSTWEAFSEEKGLGKLRILKEGAIDNFRVTYDERDFQATDEAGQPINYIPIRFISKQDGKDGRMSTREVSLDVGSTTLLFIDEMNIHDEMLEVVHDLELAKDVLANREVAKTKRAPGFAGMLSSKRIKSYDDDGNLITVEGTESQSYKQASEFMERFVYGKVKKREGSAKLFGVEVDVAKSIDSLLRYTGVRMMAGNLNVAFSNVATGEATMLKEAVGGRWFSLKDWKYGKKQFFKDVIPYAGEFGKRKTESRFGIIFEYFNPEDKIHDFRHINKDTTRLRKGLSLEILSLPNKLGSMELTASSMLAVMNKYKVKTPTGEEVNFYEALEIKDGVPTLPKGYETVGNWTIDTVRNKVIAVNQRMHGVYNLVDSSGIKAHSIGRLVLAMRDWLRPGINARWRLEHYDQRLGTVEEGYYISALRFFHNMFGEKGYVQGSLASLGYLINLGPDHDFLTEVERDELTEEQKNELTNLRKANMRKFMFELYLITALAALAMFAWDEDEKDSFLLYQIVRLKRELSTFFSPTEAWSVLRSPTIAYDTIQRLGQFVNTTTTGILSGEAFEEYKQGPSKGEVKIWSQLQNKIPVWSQRNQFEEFDRRIDLIERGWK